MYKRIEDIAIKYAIRISNRNRVIRDNKNKIWSKHQARISIPYPVIRQAYNETRIKVERICPRVNVISYYERKLYYRTVCLQCSKIVVKSYESREISIVVVYDDKITETSSKCSRISRLTCTAIVVWTVITGSGIFLCIVGSLLWNIIS